MNNRYSYKDLEVWHLSISLAEQIYKLTRKFPPDERFGMISQLRRSSISVSTNICEGKGRLTPGEFRRFLTIARGSAFEVNNLLELSLVLNFCKDDEIKSLLELIDKISAMLFKLIHNIHIPKKEN